MKALSVDKNGKLEVCQIDRPTYGDCQALVKTLSCGVCNGTDMKLIHGNFKLVDQYPTLLGHEAVGRVIEIGSKVKGLKVGDMVLLPYLYGKPGGYFTNWGGYAEYTVVGDAQAYMENGMGPGTPLHDEAVFAQTVIRPEDKVDAVGASMIITFREVLSAMRRFGFFPNADAAIFGAGPVGLCFTKFAKLLGLHTVISVDIFDEKVAQAKAMGADYAFNSKMCDIEAEVRRLLPKGADFVVDAVGVNDLLNQGLRLVKDNGKVCCYGISPNLGMNLNWSGAPYNWGLQFVQMPSKLEEAQAHNQVMSWLNFGILNPYDFISDVVPFENILDAFALVEKRGASTQKIVIRYDE